MNMVMVGWLHTMDQEVSGRCHWQCVMGCFAFAAPSPRKYQVKVLWNMIQLYYNDAWVTDSLDSLTEKMIKYDNKPPRQKSRVAQGLYLLPFATKLVATLVGENEHFG